ncbi:hypothetical protein ACQJBY_050755 [Aegilops geniculata]
MQYIGLDQLQWLGHLGDDALLDGMLDRRRACCRHGLKDCWALLGGSRALHSVKSIRSSCKSINRWLQTYNDIPSRNGKSNRSSCQPFAQHWESLPPDRRHPTTWRRNYKKASPSLLQYRPRYNCHHFRIQITPSLPNSKQEAIAQRPTPIASRSQATNRRARNQEAAMSGRRNRGEASAPPALAPPGPGERPPPSSQSSRRPAAATLEQRLRSSVEREIDDARATQRAEAGQGSSSLSHSTSAPASSRSRFWPRARQAARKVLGISKKPSARSAAGTPHGQDTVPDASGTSESAAVAAARTGTGDEAGSEQQPVEVAPTRSEFAAMMQTALAKIQEGDAADDQAKRQAAIAEMEKAMTFAEMEKAMTALMKIQEDAAVGDEAQGQAAFAEMEKAMTGLMDLSHKKTSGPPKLPRDFATKWPHSDGDPLLERVMKDPIILASGYTVDKSCQQWSLAQKNTCPVTGHSLPHSLTAPNHLLHDMIAEWCLDHSNLARSSIGRSLPLVPPAEDEIQEILELFSGHSVRQKEALRMLNLMSKTSKGMQPCLAKWPELTPLLMDLR